jgi:hypothetical protein
MKKFRGKKRYYRNLRNRTMHYSLNLSDDSWFDMWHTHLDWSGKGNQGLKPRRDHLIALFSLYEHLFMQLQSFSTASNLDDYS